jgi:hypothetical protein
VARTTEALTKLAWSTLGSGFFPTSRRVTTAPGMRAISRSPSFVEFEFSPLAELVTNKTFGILR